MTKICCRCKIEKELSFFYPSRRCKDGFLGHCIACEKRYQQNPKRKTYKQSYVKQHKTIFKQYKATAKTKNLSFSLSYEDFLKLIMQKCYYCDEYSDECNLCGIDRVNNNIGYVLSNCVACCKNCNFMKKELEQDLFINQAIKIGKKFLNL